MNEFLKLVDKYLDIPELDAAILNELVSKIVVHSPVRENGRKHVQIDLYFKMCIRDRYIPAVLRCRNYYI